MLSVALPELLAALCLGRKPRALKGLSKGYQFGERVSVVLSRVVSVKVGGSARIERTAAEVENLLAGVSQIGSETS